MRSECERECARVSGMLLRNQVILCAAIHTRAYIIYHPFLVLSLSRPLRLNPASPNPIIIIIARITSPSRPPSTLQQKTLRLLRTERAKAPFVQHKIDK